jgi:hypothetical protein
MWTRLASLLAAMALAAMLNVTVIPNSAWAVICGNVGEPAAPNTAGATDGRQRKAGPVLKKRCK